MQVKKTIIVLLALVAFSMNAWSYRVTDNYTIESKFRINALGAGIAFRAYEGFGSNICMWQFNVGTDGTKSLFRPHDWKVGGVLLGEVDTRNFGVTLNTTDWFVTKIVVSNNGQHADTYLRRAEDNDFVCIDSRDGNFRFGMVGTRQDHDGEINESATYDYFKVTANETGEVLYNEDFDATDGDWRNDPIWDEANGTLTTEGRDLNEVRYFPNNMFKDAIDMHYTVEADMTIESGYLSFIFGLTEGGSNYMWQISPNYRNDGSANTYYHLDRGNESWKAHAAGPNYPDFAADDFYNTKRHIMIEVEGNVVSTYIDGELEDVFVQNDMTDLELLNSGKVGIRADAGNGTHHKVYVDNLKLTEYSKTGNATIKMHETFDDGVAHFFELTGKNATYASVVEKDGDYALLIDCDGTTDEAAKVRLIQTDVCFHNYQNGICTLCDTYEEPGYNTELSAYTIGNLGQMIRFSQIVNTEDQAANGLLTADIDMENSDRFEPIGLNNDDNHQTPFRGSFYGNNHVVRNLYVKTDCEGGFFSRLRGGRIYNLGIEDAHIESTTNLRCGAIVGEHHDNAWMYNCYVRGTIVFVTDHAQKDAIAGEGHGGHFVNCYTTLSRICCDLPNGGTEENCFEGVTAEQTATGEICHKLGDAFGQSIGTDTYPVFGGEKVYYVGDEGYATFFDASKSYTLAGDVQAKIGKIAGNYISLTDIADIPAGTAVILKGGYYNMVEGDATAVTTGNDLKGTSEDTPATGQYVLAKPADEEVGFYQATTGTIKAGKAYIESTSGVKAFFFTEDNATGIVEIENGELEQSPTTGSERPIYNVAGQRLHSVQKGINIVGGKKIAM